MGPVLWSLTLVDRDPKVWALIVYSVRFVEPR